MKFQIEKLIIWPRKENRPPREVIFKTGKVNVITGASRTGKSAIIPIIDYCLGSGSCSIPIEIIRNNASWYGVVVDTEVEKILLARRVPDGSKGAQDYFVSRGQVIAVPLMIDRNQTLTGVKELLDSIASVPYCNRDEDSGPYNDRLSFRDLTHLVFQSQDIMANQNILFYKTHETEHREKLKNWFPFILGAETEEMIAARRELKDLEVELKRRQREYDKAKLISAEWLQNLLGQLHVAKEYGLYDKDIPKIDKYDELLIIATEILGNKPDAPQTTVDSLGGAAEEIIKLEKQEDELSAKIAVASKRLKEVDQLKASLSGYHGSTGRKVDRLGLSQWMKNYAKDANECPVCGGSDHPNAREELDKICKALARYEDIANKTAQLPAAFDREQEILRKELQELIQARSDLQRRFDFIRSRNEAVAKRQQQTREMFLFLGQLTSTVELINRLTSTGGVEDKIKELEAQIQRLRGIVSASSVKKATDRALGEIGAHIFTRLQTLDVDASYKVVPPIFNLRELGIQVQGSDGSWHMLAEVGSASNWVAFHIAFMCALQEFFTSRAEPPSPVPSFVVFDQPSQVYFPRLRGGDNNEDPNYEKDEDVTAVKSMFKTLADSIKASNGKWQAIVLDHARDDIYGGIDGVEEVEVWRDGKKLIPTSWYEDKD